jgi:hypothetical protein
MGPLAIFVLLRNPCVIWSFLCYLVVDVDHFIVDVNCFSYLIWKNSIIIEMWLLSHYKYNVTRR